MENVFAPQLPIFCEKYAIFCDKKIDGNITR